MNRCPACGVPLGVVLSLETSYSRTQALLRELTSDYSKLPWQQSQNLKTLCTIHLTSAVLQNTLARSLYEKVRTAPLKIGEITFKLSTSSDGTQWLQKWARSN